MPLMFSQAGEMLVKNWLSISKFYSQTLRTILVAALRGKKSNDKGSIVHDASTKPAAPCHDTNTLGFDVKDYLPTSPHISVKCL